MRRLFSVAALVAAIFFCTGEPASAQKAKMDDDTKTTEKMLKAGTLVGKVRAVYEDKRVLSITVTYNYTVIDEGAAQQILQAQVSMRTARDINSYRQAQIQLAQAQARLYRLESTTKDYELKSIDDVLVRTARPKETFDEKGVLKKKFSKAELKEMKGDPKLPGYTAEWGDLAVDQLVQVTMVKKKGAVAAPPKAGKKGKKGEEDAVGDAIGNSGLMASVIMILRQPPGPK